MKMNSVQTIQTYYDDGALKVSYELHNGEIHGIYTEYHPNGAEYIKARYEEGQLQKRITKSQNRYIVKEETYVNGVIKYIYEYWPDSE